MRIFIDTAELREIREACSWGIVDGLTTNPTLIRKAVQARESVDIESYIAEICEVVTGPVSLEVGSLDEDTMVQEATRLFQRFNPIRQNVVIKIPTNTSTEDGQPDFEGLKAIKRLSERGVPVNATLIMTPEQALLCAKAGAKYVSPFMGRVDDFQESQTGEKPGEPLASGAQLVCDIVRILRNYPLDCEIIAASVRHVGHVRAAETSGAHIATIPFNVLLEMARHPKTAEGIRRFVSDLVPEYAKLLSSLPLA